MLSEARQQSNNKCRSLLVSQHFYIICHITDFGTMIRHFVRNSQKKSPSSPFVVLNILLGSVLLLFFPTLSLFRMTIWSVQFSDARMHAGFRPQFELCWRAGKNICAPHATGSKNMFREGCFELSSKFLITNLWSKRMHYFTRVFRYAHPQWPMVIWSMYETFPCCHNTHCDVFSVTLCQCFRLHWTDF